MTRYGMQLLSDFKKIIIFLGGQLKSTLQMLTYLNKNKPSEEQKKDADSPPEKTPSKRKKKPLPPIDILKDAPSSPQNNLLLRLKERINLSNYRILIPMLMILIILIIGLFWMFLDKILPAPTSQATATISSTEDQVAEKNDSQSNSTLETPPVEEPSSEQPKIESQVSAEETPKISSESSTQNDSPPPIESTTTEESTESPIYQPYLNLEETKGLARKINPHFFMETPPIDSKGNPINLPPRVAIIVYNVGINDLETDILLSELPDEVGISLSPYTENIESLINDIKNLGSDVFIQMPWENDSLYTDQGNLTVLTGLNQEKLTEILNKYKPLVKKADGFFAEGGSKLMKTTEELSTTLKFITATKNKLITPPDILMTTLHEQTAEIKVNYIGTTLVNPGMNNLEIIESLSRRTGFAVIAFSTKPTVLREINNWIHKLEEAGIEIVPPTKLLKD